MTLLPKVPMATCVLLVDHSTLAKMRVQMRRVVGLHDLDLSINKYSLAPESNFMGMLGDHQ
jgi:hypothetical protein